MHTRAFPYTDLALVHWFVLRTGLSRTELLTCTQRMMSRGITVNQYNLAMCFEVIHECFVLPLSNLDYSGYQPMGGVDLGDHELSKHKDILV